MFNPSDEKDMLQLKIVYLKHLCQLGAVIYLVHGNVSMFDGMSALALRKTLIELKIQEAN